MAEVLCLKLCVMSSLTPCVPTHSTSSGQDLVERAEQCRWSSPSAALKLPLEGYIYGGPVGEITALNGRISRVAAVEVAFCPAHDITEKISQMQFPLSSLNWHLGYRAAIILFVQIKLGNPGAVS
jgi:hypothetical protein